MSLVLPSEALGGSFILPTADDNTSQIGATPVSNTLLTYGLVFGNLGLLLPPDTVSAVVESDVPQCRLPNTPPWLHGMINVNGNVVPLFNLAALLGFPNSGSANAKLLVIGQGEDAVAVTLDNLPLRVRLKPADQLTSRPPLPASLQPFARACYKTERLWVDWDVDSFFTAVGEHLEVAV